MLHKVHILGVGLHPDSREPRADGGGDLSTTKKPQCRNRLNSYIYTG